MDEQKTDIEPGNNEDTTGEMPEEAVSSASSAEQFENEKYYRCIDGIRRKNRIIGRCWCDAHVGALTPELLKAHDCLNKKCPFLIRFEEKPFWKERERQKKQSHMLREQKQKAEQKFKNAMHAAETLLKDIPNIKIQRAEPFKGGIKIWVYTPSLQNIVKIHTMLKAALGIPVWLTRINLSYSDSVKALGDKFRPVNEKEEKIWKMKSIVQHTRDNQPDIAASELCGCYNCLNIFSPEDITVYVRGSVFSTARCPVCGRMTVLPQHSDYKLSKKLLNDVRLHFYKPIQPPRDGELYIGNIRTKKLHTYSCRYASGKNQISFNGAERAIKAGYCPCKLCMKDFDINANEKEYD